jgi:hypothetical protein
VGFSPLPFEGTEILSLQAGEQAFLSVEVGRRGALTVEQPATLELSLTYESEADIETGVQGCDFE